jgi:hypothetical protein
VAAVQQYPPMIMTRVPPPPPPLAVAAGPSTLFCTAVALALILAASLRSARTAARCATWAKTAQQEQHSRGYQGIFPAVAVQAVAVALVMDAREGKLMALSMRMGVGMCCKHVMHAWEQG